MKHIYFIRHGETAKNRGRIHQGPEEPLTERGREQVRDAIIFLRNQNIDTLVSSNYVRARETADIVANDLGLPYTIEPSVREFGRPGRSGRRFGALHVRCLVHAVLTCFSPFSAITLRCAPIDSSRVHVRLM